MSLRHKLLAILLFLLIILGTGIAIIQQQVVIPKVEAFAIEALKEDLERIKEGLDRELTHMKRMATDWAQWDETYEFVQAPSAEYLESALGGDAMEQLSMDMLLISQDEKVVTFKTIPRLLTYREPLIATLMQSDQPRLLAPGGQGLITTPAGVMLIASSPILPTTGEGTPRGTLYFAQLLDLELTHQLRPPQIQSIRVGLDPIPPGPDQIELLPGEDSISKTWLPLVNDPGQSLQIELNQGRPFLNSMRSYTYYIMGTIFVLGVLGSIATYLLLKFYLLTPLQQLQLRMRTFSASHSMEDVPDSKSSDEIGQLTRSFRDMALRISDKHSRMLHTQAQLKEESLTDPLTGLGNRRYLEYRLGQPDYVSNYSYIATFSTDLDYFKQVNDRHGHDSGDTVLREFSQLLKECCRDDDCVARVGGEEFIAVCGLTTVADASEIAERIRSQTEQKGFVGGTIPLTCSVGFIVTPAIHLEQEATWDRVFKVADMALYEAKEQGRNRWIGWRYPNLSCESSQSLPTNPNELNEAIKSQTLIPIT